MLDCWEVVAQCMRVWWLNARGSGGSVHRDVRSGSIGMWSLVGDVVAQRGK
jgi:hypothetical protein